MNDCDDFYQWQDVCLRWQYEDVDQRAMMRDDSDVQMHMEIQNDDGSN